MGPASIIKDSGLPVMEIAGKVNDLLKSGQSLVITAPPGAGKSTVLPLTILEGLDSGGKVVMLEPRRLAARQVAERMAFLLGEKVGETVGYRVRFESKVSSKTRIEVITEGILSRMMVEDPTLDGIDVLIFDEFHERSIHSDEALALARETQSIVRDDLKIVVMSATMDTSSVCKALEAPFVESEGRMWSVETVYSEEDTDPRKVAEDTARAVLRAHRSLEGDILAFLPGEADIRKCASLLEGELGATHILPLYGMLPFEEQNRAISPSLPGERKVVLATSIAETSITIEGVRVVIDSGLYRTQIYNPKDGQSHLETVLVSRDMATQRSGRAGRVAEGTCVRLYRERTFRAMKETRVPEILEADLTALALDLEVWGAGDGSSLKWITPPPAWKIATARTVLKELGAIDKDGKITSLGRRIASFPSNPRVSRMMVEAGSSPVLGALAADLAAIIEDRDPLPAEEYGTDIDVRVSALRDARSKRTPNRKWARTIRAAEQFRRMIHVPEDNSPADSKSEGMLLSRAFPERIGRLGDEDRGHYTLASGDKVWIDRNDEMASAEYIVAVSANTEKEREGKVFLAAEVSAADLEAIARKVEKLQWNPKEGTVTSRMETRIGNLLIDSKPVSNVSREAVIGAICEAAPKYGPGMFDFSEDLKGLQRRIAATAAWRPELELPDLSQEKILERVREWLPEYFTSPSELKRIDLCKVIWGLLDYSQQQNVERFAPSHIEVPTGSRIKVEYRLGAEAPVLRVRLQECFGLLETPRVDGGRRPVLMELLSPGYKPVQLTSDLANFWKETYFEVRKELKRRYPKHSWPDNPLEAEAVRGVKRKQ